MSKQQNNNQEEIQSREQQIAIHIINIVNYLLRQIGDTGAVKVSAEDGKIYDDDVSSYHLCELLVKLDSYRYKNYLDDILNYYHEHSSTLQNPFLINAMIISGYKDNSFIQEALKLLTTKGRLPNGLFSMYTGYLQGGDHFSTLWAIKILCLTSTADYKTEIENALDQCISDIEVLKAYPSHVGFLLLNLNLSNFSKYESITNEIIEYLLVNQKNGVWDEIPLTTAYLIEDLLPFSERPEVKTSIENGLTYLFDLNKPSVTDLPNSLKDVQERASESLFLQTLCRICITGSLYLEKFHKMDMGLASISNIVGQYSYLSNTALSLQTQVKKFKNIIDGLQKHLIHLDEEVARFWEKYPYEKNIFIMMRYKNEVRFRLVEQIIKEQFAKYGLFAHLAKDKKIVDDLWDNICIYMLASKFGVVVFEQAQDENFNPNISLELGFMLSRGKRVLLLKDKDLVTLPTDVVGKLYDDFDIGNPDTLRNIIDKWVADVVLL